jgi:lysozyme
MDFYKAGRLIVGGVAAVTALGYTGALLIKQSEGLSYTSYQDSAGIWTICYGHTGPEVGPRQRATQAQCDALFDKDVRKHAAGVLSCTKRPLNQNQFDAVVSLAFNIGVRNYCNSTLSRKINAGDWAGAANEFPKWNKVTIDGRKVALRGLTNRRLKEQALFMAPEAHDRAGRLALKELVTQ